MAVDKEFEEASERHVKGPLRKRKGIDLVTMTVNVTPETLEWIRGASRAHRLAQGAVVDKMVTRAIAKANKRVA